MRAEEGARSCYSAVMRTTIEFDPDVAKAVEDLRREHGTGVSAAVNTLIRRGMTSAPPRPRFQQRTAHLGLALDVSNVADALEILEGADAR